MKRNLSQPTSVPQQKGSNQKPQISSDASEPPDSELNKVTGGDGRDPTAPKISEITITKLQDVATPKLR